VIVDEFGSNLNLTPRYGRAPRGHRAIGRVPRNTPANTTVIASLSLEGMGPSMLLSGATDGLAFEAYVEQVLAPTLRSGQIVVMDNLSAHQSTQVQASIAARGCELWFLPAYSPDLSPIELAIAKIKQGLRRKGARDEQTLESAIMDTLPTVSAADAQGFFTACGYLRRHAQSHSL
jgi:transposase